jgi:hypothetical protein
VRTLANLESTRLGFNRENVPLFSLSPGHAGYKDAQIVRFYEDLRSRFDPFRACAAWASRITPWCPARCRPRISRCRGVPGISGTPTTSYLHVDASFLATMQIPLRLGRGITGDDTAETTPFIIVGVTAPGYGRAEGQPQWSRYWWQAVRPRRLAIRPNSREMSRSQ